MSFFFLILCLFCFYVEWLKHYGQNIWFFITNLRFVHFSNFSACVFLVLIPYFSFLYISISFREFKSDWWHVLSKVTNEIIVGTWEKRTISAAVTWLTDMAKMGKGWHGISAALCAVTSWSVLKCKLLKNKYLLFWVHALYKMVSDHWHKTWVQKVLFSEMMTILVFNTLRFNSPLYLSNLLSLYIPARSLQSSADKTILNIPSVQTEGFGHRSFFHSAPTIWSSLLLSIRSSDCFFI